jgi:hypothetical protein
MEVYICVTPAGENGKRHFFLEEINLRGKHQEGIKVTNFLGPTEPGFSWKTGNEMMKPLTCRRGRKLLLRRAHRGFSHKGKNSRKPP